MTTKEELKLELERIRAERAAFEASTHDADAELREAIESEQRELDAAKAIAEAVEKHGDLGVKTAALKTRLGVIIVKRANHLHFRRFQDSQTVTSEVLDKLIRPCVVHPSLDRYDAITEELPAVITSLGKLISDLSGLRAKEVQGKF